MKDESRSMNKSAFAQLARAKSADAVSCAVVSVVLSVVAAAAKSEAAAAQVEAGGPVTVIKKGEGTVKTVKSVFAIFQFQVAAVQSVPIRTSPGDFTAFALILRMGMGGRGSMNPNLNLNLNNGEL